jgi:anti-anti-sigma factor
MLSSVTNVAIEYHFSTHADGAVVLELSGEVDLAGTAVVEPELWERTREPPPLLVLDLRAVKFLDSAGVLLLLRAYRWQKAADQRLRIVLNPRQSAYRVLASSGLMQIPGIEWDSGIT